MLESLLMPPGGVLLVILAGTLLWRRRLGRRLLACGLLAGYLSSIPASIGWLDRLVAPPPPLDVAAARASGAQAVVVLAGGLSGTAPEYGGVTLNVSTLARVRYGAHLARATGLPVLVTGGYRDHGRSAPEGVLMAQALREEFGITDVLVEGTSQTTRENARNSAPLLRARGIKRILLVSNAWHLPRAREAFARDGFEVVAAPTLYFANPDYRAEPGDFVPQPGAVYGVYYALHELIGRIVYRLRDGAVAS